MASLLRDCARPSTVLSQLKLNHEIALTRRGSFRRWIAQARLTKEAVTGLVVFEIISLRHWPNSFQTHDVPSTNSAAVSTEDWSVNCHSAKKSCNPCPYRPRPSSPIPPPPTAQDRLSMPQEYFGHAPRFWTTGTRWRQPTRLQPSLDTQDGAVGCPGPLA